MSIRPSLISAALLAAFPAFSHGADSVAPDVVVTATRQATRADELTSSVEVIDRARIEHSGARDLVDLLSAMPGLRISRNGGVGASASLYIRGAEARHTLLLIDGMRIGSATTGTPTLETIPLALVDHIEILRGPASALYGSEAIGGVVQIFTRQGEPGLHPELYAAVGNRGNSQTEASLRGGSERLRYAFSVGNIENTGINSNPDPVKQPHYYQPDRDGYHDTHVSGQISLDLGGHDEVGANVYAVDGRNHYDAYGSAYDAYLDKRESVFGLHYTKQIGSDWRSTFRLGQSKDELKNYSWAGAPGVYNTTQQQFAWQNDVRLPLGSLLAAYEHLHEKADGSTAYTVDSRRVNSFLLGWHATVAERHLAQVNVRNDDNSQFGRKTTGHLGYAYLLTDALRVQASVATAFNAPTFNQLYWPDTGYGGGNPDLKPEKAINREIGLRYESGAQHASITYYNNRVRDLIAGWPASNIAHAKLEGVELGYGTTWLGYSLDAGMDFLRAKDQDSGKELPRRANAAAFLRASREVGAWSWGADWNGVGKRWDDASNTHAMGGYGLLNAFVHYRATPEWRIELNADNLLDKQYETAWGYGSPGAAVLLGLRYTPR